MQNIQSIKFQICRIGRIMYERGYISGFDGNILVRVDKDKIIIIFLGVLKGFLNEDMLVLIDMEGKIFEKINYKLLFEIKMYFKVY